MKQSENVPADVLELPADRSGNGFMVKDKWLPAIEGSDGQVYNRYQGIVIRDGE